MVKVGGNERIAARVGARPGAGRDSSRRPIGVGRAFAVGVFFVVQQAS